MTGRYISGVGGRLMSTAVRGQTRTLWQGRRREFNRGRTRDKTVLRDRDGRLWLRPASARLSASRKGRSSSSSVGGEVENKFLVPVGTPVVNEVASGVQICARTARDGPVHVGVVGRADERLECDLAFRQDQCPI